MPQGNQPNSPNSLGGISSLLSPAFGSALPSGTSGADALQRIIVNGAFMAPLEAIQALLQAQAQGDTARVNSMAQQISAQIGANASMANTQTQSATQLGLGQMQNQLGVAGLNQNQSQFAQQFGLSQQGQAFNQELQGSQLGMQQQGQAFNQQLQGSQFGLGIDQFLSSQAQFGANFGLERDKFNSTQSLAEQEFNNQFGLSEDQFAFQKEQAARQLASNPFDSLNYMMYLSGMAASPIGAQPGYNQLNDQFNRYNDVHTAPLQNQAPGIINPLTGTVDQGKDPSAVARTPIPQPNTSIGAPAPTIQASPYGVNGAAVSAAQNMALGGPMGSYYKPSASGLQYVNPIGFAGQANANGQSGLPGVPGQPGSAPNYQGTISNFLSQLGITAQSPEGQKITAGLSGAPMQDIGTDSTRLGQAQADTSNANAAHNIDNIMSAINDPVLKAYILRGAGIGPTDPNNIIKPVQQGAAPNPNNSGTSKAA